MFEKLFNLAAWLWGGWNPNGIFFIEKQFKFEVCSHKVLKRFLS